MKCPRLSAPTGVARVAVPTTHTAAVRRPATITGSASGSSTRYSRWRLVIPIARAASRSAVSNPARPANSF